MRKCLQSLLAVFAISMVCGGFINAQFDNSLYISDLFVGSEPKFSGAYNSLLNDYSKERGYGKEQLKCDITNSNLKVSFPVIYESTQENYKEATYYDIFLSPYRLDELKTRNDIDSSKVLKKRVSNIPNAEEISIELSQSDGLDANQVYYGFIVPINEYDVVGAPSEEICFQMSNTMCVQGSECDSIASLTSINDGQVTGTHGAAGSENHGAANCVSMDYAHIDHKVDYDKGVIILTWSAVSDSDIDIAIRDPETKEFKFLATVPASKEKYEYEPTRDFEQNFSFNNGCGLPTQYKVDFEPKEKAKTSEKIVTPATGPAENVLYIVIAAIVLYGAYAIFGRKSEN